MSYRENRGAEIDWARGPNGRYIPVDPEPVFVIEGEGTERFYDDELGMIASRRAKPEEARTRETKIKTLLAVVQSEAVKGTCEIWGFGSIFVGEFRFFVRNIGRVGRAEALMDIAICATNFIIYIKKTTEKRIYLKKEDEYAGNGSDSTQTRA